ncbi:MAG: hypothetical protein ACJ8CH_24420 [Microvirga sp.]
MPWFSRLYREELEIAAGNAVVPERPGWGFSLDWDHVAKLQEKGDRV